MASSAERTDKTDKPKRKPRFQQPPLTEEYQVEGNDTLYSIAVAFGCTTSELRRLNRLQTSLLFPGQVLFVPDRGGLQVARPGLVTAPASEAAFEQSVPRPVTARPTDEPLSAVELAGEALDDDEGDPVLGQVEGGLERTMQCRYVTNNGEGIVPGILSVTPIHISFKPDVQNRLVMDRGVGRYTVAVDVSEVTSLGMYENAAQMAISDPPTPSGSLTAKSEVFLFCSSTEWSKYKMESPVPVLNALSSSSCAVNVEIEDARNALDSPSQSHDLSGSPVIRGGAATVATTTHNESTEEESLVAARVQPVSHPVPIERAGRSNPNPGLPLSPSLPRYLCIRTDPLLPPAQLAASERKPEYWFAMQCHEISPLYDFLESCCTSLVPVDHHSLTEALSSYVVVNSFEIEEGLDIVEDFFSSSEAKGCYLSPLVTTGGNKVSAKPDFVRTRKATPAEAKVNQPSPAPASAASSSSWQDRVPSIQRRLSYELPMMTDESQLMSYEHLCKLARHLPNSVVGCSWRLAYSTCVHGISLRTMYRNMREMDGPILLAVRDSNHHVFGVLSSTQFRICEKFIGTGQCFLYTFHEGIGLKIFTWTGENEFYVKCDPNALCFGSGDGAFGLWLDEELYRGSSAPCKTYDNEVLSSTEQFTIQSVEAWCFD